MGNSHKLYSDRGLTGWLNDEIVEWFGDYAALIAKTFGSRVKNFFTINEPQCFICMLNVTCISENT